MIFSFVCLFSTWRTWIATRFCSFDKSIVFFTGTWLTFEFMIPAHSEHPFSLTLNSLATISLLLVCNGRTTRETRRGDGRSQEVSLDVVAVRKCAVLHALCRMAQKDRFYVKDKKDTWSIAAYIPYRTDDPLGTVLACSLDVSRVWLVFVGGL